MTNEKQDAGPARTTGAKYRPYPTYKPSGAAWIGDIPEGWEVRKIKHATTVVLGKMISTMPIAGYFLKPYLKSRNIAWEKPVLDNVDEMYFSKNELTQYRLKKDDLLVSEGGEVGKTCLWNNEIAECYIQNSVHKITVNADLLLPKYLLFVFITYGSGKVFPNIVNQVSIAHLTKDKLTTLPIPLPPLPEQRAIAAFLDRETARLNAIIVKQTQMLALLREKRAALITQAVTKGLSGLVSIEDAEFAQWAQPVKYKPSGAAWIGEIPEGWEIIKLKFLTKTISKGTTPSTEGRETLKEGKIKFIKAENVSQLNCLTEEPLFFIDEDTNTLLRRSILSENDILIVIAGATIGKVAMMRKDFLPANTNQAVCFIRVKSSYSIPFLWYVLQSDFIQIIIGLSAVQSAQPNLAMGQIKNFPTSLPPLPEQQAIAAFLDRETSRIDAMAAKIDAQIALLHEYKHSLITHAVTGKIDVRGEQ